jgi:hypothetical protein
MAFCLLQGLAMAGQQQQIQQQQSAKEQLAGSVAQLLSGEAPEVQAGAAIAVGCADEGTCAALMLQQDVDVRRAGVMQLVREQAGGEDPWRCPCLQPSSCLDD